MAYRSLLVGLLLVLPHSIVHAQDAAASVTKAGTFTEDLYVAGGRVSVFADVTGDVVAAGGRVTIDQQVAGDVIAAGGIVNINARVLDDVRAAGGAITISGQIGDDAIAAGGSVSLAPSATVGGRAWLAGGEIEVAGRIAKELKAGGGTIVISGEIEGDAELVSDNIEILPTARIKGNLNYRSRREANIDPGAQIDGQITHRPFELPQKPTRIHGAGVGIVMLMSLMVTGIVLFLYFPNFSAAAARTVESDSWKCLGLGLAVLVTTPVVAGLLMLTIIGIPLGLIILALYFVFLIAGYLTGVLYLGDVGIRWLREELEPSKGWRVLSVVAALIVLGIIGFIPFIGSVIGFLVLLFGLGALKLQTYREYSQAQPTSVSAKPRRGAKRR